MGIGKDLPPDPRACKRCGGRTVGGGTCDRCKRKSPVRVYRVDGAEPEKQQRTDRRALSDLEFWKTSGAEIDSYTYFIQCSFGGPVKIGVAIDPARRCSYLQTGNAYPLVVRHVLPLDCEAILHRRYTIARLTGEWFDDPGGIILDDAAKAAAYCRENYFGGPFVYGRLEEAFENLRTPRTLHALEFHMTHGVEGDWERGYSVDEIARRWRLPLEFVAHQVAKLNDKAKAA